MIKSWGKVKESFPNLVKNEKPAFFSEPNTEFHIIISRSGTQVWTPNRLTPFFPIAFYATLIV